MGQLMLRKFVIITSGFVLHSTVQANVFENSIPEPVRLQNTLISCLTLSKIKQQKCVTNVGNAVRNSINTNLLRLEERDRIYFLNLRGYPAEKAKYSCLSYQAQIDQNICVTKINIVLLSELSQRYLK